MPFRCYQPSGRRLADRWDDDFHLPGTPRDGLTFCHGAAGVLAVADAFSLHTGLMPARRLADHLAGLLTGRLASLATTDLPLVTG